MPVISKIIKQHVAILLCLYLIYSNESFAENWIAPTRQSEIYIRGFKSSFDSLHSNEKGKIVHEIKRYAQELYMVLDSAGVYREYKEMRIKKIRETPATTDEERYIKYAALYEEYMQCCFDSAFYASAKCLEVATALGDAALVADAYMKMCEMYISGGYFREAEKALDGFDCSMLPDEVRLRRLMLKFRLEFENGFYFGWRLYSPDMAYKQMQALYDELVGCLPDDAYEVYFLKAMMAFYKHDYKTAVGYSEILILKAGHDKWKYINAIGNMGYCKLGAGDFVNGMKYMVESAKLAVREGSNNYSALRKIAEIMYVTGDIEQASEFIGLAMDNATEYNSKYRIIESSKGYPMINRQLRAKIEHDNFIITVIAFILAVFVILLSLGLVYIAKQHRKLHEQARIIGEHNRDLQAKSREIEDYNRSLIEVHKVTSVLVSKMMTGVANRRNLIERLRKELTLKIKVKQYDGIVTVVDLYKKDLISTYVDIDEILLAFFPNFVSQFNALLPDDCRMKTEEHGTLPAEMRIFALWRLGIKKNEDIARCMGYAVNTIKSYKTRIINSSNLDKEDFYRRLMDITIDYKD